MGAELIKIDYSMLETHRGRVNAVAADIEQAASVAGSISLGDGAFGIMCQFMVPPIGIVNEVAKAVLRDAAKMVRRSADEVSAVGSEFSQYEHEVIDTCKALQNELPR